MDESFQADFARTYPGLKVNFLDDRCLQIYGVLKIKSSFVRITLTCPHYPNMKTFSLIMHTRQEFKQFNIGNFPIKDGCTLTEFMDLIPTLHSTHSKKSTIYKKTKNIYAEIPKIYDPDSFKIQMTNNLTRICFCHFVGHDQHYLTLKLPSLELLEHSLPDSVPLQESFKKVGNELGTIVSLFQKYLGDLRPFFECFADIDELCHILQPASPTTKDNWRLFLLQDRVYLKVTIGDPFATVSSMSVQILGPTPQVERLRRIYSDGMRSWDPELGIQKNLLRIFDLCFFPIPPSGNSDEPYCNICYCFRLFNEEVPIISCDNDQCSLVFHGSCLREWFNTLSDGKTFLDVSFCTCPYCKAKLSTSFTALLDK